MKKSINLFLAIFTVGLLYADDYSALTQIELKSQSGATNAVFVVENPNSTTMVDSANIASLFEYTSNTENVNIYVLNDANKYSQLSKKVLSNIPMGILTNREDAAMQKYTLTFNVYGGRNLKLYDVVLDSLMEMKNSNQYVFEVNTTNCPSYVAGTNTRIEDRFIIEPVFAFQVCAYKDYVEITGNEGTDNIVITNMAGDTVVNVAPVAVFQSIDLSGKDAGHYVLTVNGTDYEFCNKPVSNN